MAKSKKEPVKVKKHTLREQIATTLQTTFTDLKETVGEKKFNRHVKKASKVLAAGAEKKTEKTAAPAKAAAIKKVKAKASESKTTKATAAKPAKTKATKPAKAKAVKSAPAKAKAAKPAKAKAAKKKGSAK